MGFGIEVLTSAGAQLLRQAKAASKKIVITRAKCGSQWDMDRGDLCGKPLEFYDGATGSIDSVSMAKGYMQVVASFEAVDSGTDPVKSVCICAQIKKNGVSPTYDPADDVPFAACSDDNSGHISGIGFSVEFGLPISDGASIVQSGSAEIYKGEVTVDIGDGIAISDATQDDGEHVSISYDGITFGGGDLTDESEILYATMVKSVSINTGDKTCDITLGDGTVYRLTCTSVEEVSE